VAERAAGVGAVAVHAEKPDEIRLGLVKRREKHMQGLFCQGKPISPLPSRLFALRLRAEANRSEFAMLRLPRRLFAAAMLVLRPQPLCAAPLDRVRETKPFRIGYRADAKPHSFRNAQGQPAGYVVDLCREVAAAVSQAVGGAQAAYVLVPADQRFEQVRDGKV